MEFYDIPLAVLAFLILLANSLVCVVVYRTRSLRTYTNGFVVSLAVSDILTGGVFFPCYFARASFIGYVVSIVLLSGVMSVCLVTFDRYIAVLYPLRYRNIVQKLFSKLIIGGWVITVLYSIVPLIWKTNARSLAHKIYMVFHQLAVWIPYICIFAVYYRIYCQVKRCIRSEDCLSLRGSKNSLCWWSREAKYIQIFSIITLMFLISWLPILYMTAVAWFEREDLIPLSLSIISHYTMALGSLVNPFVYSFKKPDFRKALYALLSSRSNTIARPGRYQWFRQSTRSETKSKGSIRETIV